MASPNLNLRDPVMYRILHATHHRTGDKWCIYPTYDFTHGQSDSIERITHSICTLEFENHRPLYDWYIRRAGDLRPAADRVRPPEPDLYGDEQAAAAGAGQARFRPAAGTIRGCRPFVACAAAATPPRPSATFCARIGVSKFDSVVDIALLEHCLRDDLNRRAARVMAVLRPLKVVIDNYPAGHAEQMEAVNNPEDAGDGHAASPLRARTVHRAGRFPRGCRRRNIFRLAPGQEVRLRYAYLVTLHRRGEGPAQRRGHRGALHL